MKKIRVNENNPGATFSFLVDFQTQYDEYHSVETRLRSCSASVGYTKGYYYLRSYNTIVALIDTGSREAFDILRTVYGYTQQAHNI